MKLRLPISLLTVLLGCLCSTNTVHAIDIPPGSNPIDLGALGIETSLSGGTQTGAITGAGNLIIASGTVSIDHSTGVNAYTGNTIVNAGASLNMTNWSGGSSSVYHQFGTGTLVLSGTLNFNTGSKDPSAHSFNNNIELRDGAVMSANDMGITFGGNISMTSGTAHMKMQWGNEWVFSGQKTGAGTISFERNGENEVQLFVLRGDCDTFTGTYQLNTDGNKSTIVLENTNSAKNAHINLNSAQSYLTLKNIDATIGGLTGNGHIQNGVQTRGSTGSLTAGATKTLTIDQSNTGTDVFSGIIDNNVNITKSGVGTLQLTNLNEYSGSLLAHSGVLDVSFANSSYDLTKAHVDAGATLKLSNGSFIINSANVSLGDGNVEFSNSNNFIFNAFTNGSGELALGQVHMNGSVTAANGVTIGKKINEGDSYILFVTDSNANATTTAGNLTFANLFYKAAFSAQGNNVVLSVSGYADDVLEWTGGSGTWAMNSSTWKNNQGDGASFTADKKAVFSDVGGSTESTISLSGDITSQGILFNSDTTDYIVSGTGKLTGSATLIKDGLNTVTIQTANDYTGLTDVQRGTLVLKGDGKIAGATNVEKEATLSLARGGNMGDILGGNITILEGGTLSLNPGAGNTFTFNKALVSNSKATIEINSGTVVFSLGNSSGISNIIVDQGSTFRVNSGSLINSMGLTTEIKGGAVEVNGSNFYALADKGASLIFSEHQGTVTNNSNQWRWEGSDNPFKITVKKEASGSTISGGTICFTRGKDNLGSGIVDVQGKDTLFTISSAFAEQGGGGPEGISKKGTGTLVLTGTNNTNSTYLTIDDGTVQIKDNSSWKGSIAVKKDNSTTGRLLINNSWAVNSGKLFSNESQVTIQGAGSGLNISAATVSGTGNYTVDQGSLNIGSKTIQGTVSLENGATLISNAGTVNSLLVNTGSTITGSLSLSTLQFNLIDNFTGTYLTSNAAITFTGGKISLNMDGMNGSYTMDNDYTFNLSNPNMLTLGSDKFETSYESDISGKWDFKSYDATSGELSLTFKGSPSVPEPSSVSLGLIGLTALLLRRRRK